MKSIFILFMNLIAIAGIAQNIRVVNKTNLQPVKDVYITGSKHSATTNAKGEATLSITNETDSLCFSHASYIPLCISTEELKSNNYQVQLTKSILQLDELVVSANRWDENKDKVSSKITRIPSDEVHFQNPQTAADLLGLSNEVFIQKSQLGGGSPMIRGFSTNRILLVVDGVRMNNAIYRSGNLQNVISLDANMIQNTEVIFGPGSVMYGSDAIGGVMNFRTQCPVLSTNEKLHVTGNAYTRYASANNEKTGHLTIGLGARKWASLSSITYSDFGNLRMGSVSHEEYTRPEYADRINGQDTILQNGDPNVQKFSGYSQLNLMQKLRFVPNTNWDIQYGFHYSALSDVPRYDRLLQYKGEGLKYAEWYYGPQKWMMNSLNITFYSKNLLFDKARLTLAHQEYEESRHDRKFGKDKIRERTEYVTALSANLDLDKKLGKKTRLHYGLEGVHNQVGSTGHERSISTGTITPYASRYPDGSDYASASAYLSAKHEINHKLHIQGGLRYNYVMLNADFDTTFYPFPFNSIQLNSGALNGSVGMVYKAHETMRIKLNYSSGFRAPNMDDVGKVFDSEPGSVVVPNDQLESEYAHNLDLGISKTFFGKVQLEANGFYTYLQNAMVRRDFTFNGQDSIVYDGEMSKVQALVNTDEAYVYGFQLGFFADLTPHLFLKSHFNFTRGEDKEGLPLRHVAPLFGSTHLIVKTNKFKADVYSNYNGQINNDRLAADEQSKTYMYATDENGNPYSPSWWTLNAKVSYQVNQLLQVNAGIENILDHRYRPYSSGIVAPGRNFILALRLNM